MLELKDHQKIQASSGALALTFALRTRGNRVANVKSAPLASSLAPKAGAASSSPGSLALPLGIINAARCSLLRGAPWASSRICRCGERHRGQYSQGSARNQYKLSHLKSSWSVS